MINWTYNPNEFEKMDYALIPTGDHRVRISEVTARDFRSGSCGFEIVLDVSGYGSKLWYYLVIDRNDSKKSNQRIGTFFDCFGITDYDLNHYISWKGKVGAARVKHEDYNGETQAKAAFLISREKQEKLPPAQFGAAPVSTPVQNDDADLPFM